MVNKSESIASLAKALVAAQKKMSVCVFDKKNPFFGSDYATLNSVREAVLPILSEHGLSIAQPAIANEHGCGCETMLIHESGEWISSELILPIEKKTPQAAGGAITYARRYSLMSIACAVSGEDDDANKCEIEVHKNNILKARNMDELKKSWNNIPEPMRIDTLKNVAANHRKSLEGKSNETI